MNQHGLLNPDCFETGHRMNATTVCYIFFPVLQSFYEYGDLFSETWRAFSENDITHLKTYDSRRVGCCTFRPVLSVRAVHISSRFCCLQVCFRDAFFSLLPRMRYGLFYNTPLVSYSWRTRMRLRVNLHARLLTHYTSRAFANCHISKFQRRSAS